MEITGERQAAVKIKHSRGENNIYIYNIYIYIISWN